jgi:hypothetical protein
MIINMSRMPIVRQLISYKIEYQVAFNKRLKFELIGVRGRMSFAWSKGGLRPPTENRSIMNNMSVSQSRIAVFDALVSCKLMGRKPLYISMGRGSQTP